MFYREHLGPIHSETGCGTNSHVRKMVACNGIIMESLFVLFYMQYCQSTGQYVCHIQTYDKCHALHTEFNQFEVSCFVGVGAVCYLIILFSNILSSLIVMNF